MKDKFLILILLTFLLTSCSGMGTKRSDKSDEFLVEKKNPLVVPPEFSKLPVPKSQDENIENNVNKEEDLDLSKVLTETETTEPTNSSNELEKSISNILNKK